MSSFMETELSTRWGFEDLVLFGSKVSGNPKKLQLEDWGFGDNNEMSVGSFNPSGIGFGRGGSGSEFGNGSSGKSWSGGSEKSPSSVISTPSTTGTKKMKSASLGGSTTPRCQVEGCNLDLSSAKDYHRKHRVCDNHSKSSKVIVKGLERRFCQQCSRFHGLSEFDEKKRSCRKRLSDHNARRRKPQQEMIEFNSSRLPSSFYDGRKQMTFLLNTGSQTRNAASTDWERTYESKFTITKGNTSKPDNFGLVAGQPHMTGNQVSYAISMHGNPSNGFLAPKGTDASRVLPHAFKDVTSATMGAAPDFHRALSLLSTNSWGSSESVSLPFHNTMHASRINMPQMLMQTIPQSSLPSSEYWLDGQPSTYPHMHSLNSGNSRNGHNEGFQLPKTSYGMDFYLSPHQH